jgi:hypothetical protein
VESNLGKHCRKLTGSFAGLAPGSRYISAGSWDTYSLVHAEGNIALYTSGQDVHSVADLRGADQSMTRSPARRP